MPDVPTKSDENRSVSIRNTRFRNSGDIRGCIHKFTDWPPGARTAMVQLSATRCSCIAIVSQSSEFCSHNPL
jgi:hypothetical protein